MNLATADADCFVVPPRNDAPYRHCELKRRFEGKSEAISEVPGFMNLATHRQIASSCLLATCPPQADDARHRLNFWRIMECSGGNSPTYSQISAASNDKILNKEPTGKRDYFDYAVQGASMSGISPNTFRAKAGRYDWVFKDGG